MTLGELAPQEVRRRLQRGEMLIPMGPLLVRIQSAEPSFAATFQLLYQWTTVIEPGQAVADILAQMRPAKDKLFEWVIDGQPHGDGFSPDVAFAHFEWAMHSGVSFGLAPATAIHASVVARSDGAVAVLVGRSRSGKSTLASGLITQGWSLVADEYLVIRDDGMIDPVPGPVALKEGSIDIIEAMNTDGAFAPRAIDPQRGEVSHYATPRVIRDGATLQIGAVLFPYFRATEAPMSVPIGRGETILRLAEQSHNFHLIGPGGFRALARVSQAPAWAIRFSNMDEGIAAVTAAMEAR